MFEYSILYNSTAYHIISYCPTYCMDCTFLYFEVGRHFGWLTYSPRVPPQSTSVSAVPSCSLSGARMRVVHAALPRKLRPWFLSIIHQSC